MLIYQLLLDAYQSFQAHDEQKTRKIGYRDANFFYGPETTYHKPSLCLMLIIREPHFHLTSILTFKGFSHLLSVTLSQNTTLL